MESPKITKFQPKLKISKSEPTGYQLHTNKVQIYIYIHNYENARREVNLY